MYLHVIIMCVNAYLFIIFASKIHSEVTAYIKSISLPA